MFTLTPAECSPACENGGQCVAPNVCACPTGWTGPQCAEGLRNQSDAQVLYNHHCIKFDLGMQLCVNLPVCMVGGVLVQTSVNVHQDGPAHTVKLVSGYKQCYNRIKYIDLQIFCSCL